MDVVMNLFSILPEKTFYQNVGLLCPMRHLRDDIGVTAMHVLRKLVYVGEWDPSETNLYAI